MGSLLQFFLLLKVITFLKCLRIFVTLEIWSIEEGTSLKAPTDVKDSKLKHNVGNIQMCSQHISEYMWQKCNVMHLQSLSIHTEKHVIFSRFICICPTKASESNVRLSIFLRNRKLLLKDRKNPYSKFKTPLQ